MLIRLKQVEKVFTGDGIQSIALQETNITFQKGEFISIVGHSGSGKSTLLSLVGSLDKPSSGNIYFDDIDITSLKGNMLADFRFNNIGFIFQQFHLIPSLTALENVMAPVFSRNVSFDKTNRAKELLELVSLANKLDSLPSQLSGGEQQRVAIARALINEPNWLLADEPTGNLDTKNGELIFNLIRNLNQEKQCGVLFVTHESKLAEQADRIIEMKDGYIIHDSVGVTR